MELYSFFFNPEGRPRSGWRVLLFIFINFVFAFLFVIMGGTILALLFRSQASVQNFLEGLGGWIIQSLALLGAATLAGLVCGRFLEGLPVRALGWGLHKGWLQDLLKGSLLGALSLILAALLILLSGGYRFTLAQAGAGSVLKTLLISGIVFIIAAAAEEALFRGYPLQTMTRARLAAVGLILTSLVFAYVHRNNPNNPPGLPPFTHMGLDFVNLPFINTTLAGVWLAAGYLRTRSLWFPLGLHWAWNWTMGAVLGLPVSGIEALTPAPLLRAADTGPVWLTGGTYGVEGGLACTVALIASTLLIWRMRLVSATPDMLSLTNKENPKPGAWEKAAASAEARSPEKAQPN